MIDEREESQSGNAELKDKVGIFNLIEKYESQNKQLEEQLSSIQAGNE
jgi:hypothetical protein